MLKACPKREEFALKLIEIHKLLEEARKLHKESLPDAGYHPFSAGALNSNLGTLLLITEGCHKLATQDFGLEESEIDIGKLP